MNDYKIGDKLVCIDDRDSSNLELGGEYEITDINIYGNIQVSEEGLDLPHFYKPSRFDTIVEYKYENTPENTVKTKSGAFDASKRYKTRDGREFRFIGLSKDERFPIVGEISCGENWELLTLSEYGHFYDDSKESGCDLIEVADKIELSIGGVPVVVYDDRSILFNGNSATEPLTEKEIDLFVEALQAFKK